MNILIRLLYSLVIAGAFVAFLIVGVYSFSQPPKYPDYPNYDYGNQTHYDQQQAEFNKKTDVYNQKVKHYYKNVTYVALPVAVATSAVGLALLKKAGRFDVVGEGVALGGAGASIYSIVVANMGGAKVLSFISAGALLLLLIALTQLRFSGSKS